MHPATTPATALETFIWFIGVIFCACIFGALLPRKPRRSTGRNESLMREHRRIQERQNGGRLDGGYTCAQTLLAVGWFMAAVLFIPAVYVILMAFMGCSEPKW